MQFSSPFKRDRATHFLFCGFTLFLAAFLLPLSTKAVNNIYYALVLLPLLFALDRETLRDFHRSPLVNLWYALLGYQLLSYSWSIEYSEEFVPNLKRWLYLYGLGLVVFVLVRNDKPLSRWVIPAAPLLIALAAIGNMLWFYSTHDFPQARLVGASRISNPIFFGSIAAAFSAAALVQWHGWSRRYRLLLLLAVAVNLGIIYLSQSRTALLGVGVCIGSLLLVSPRLRWLALACAAVLGLVALVVDWQPLLARGLSYRPDIWLAQWQRVVESCSALFGCGLGINPDIAPEPEHNFHPHSVYMAWVVYGGLLGLAAYLAILGLILRASLKVERLLPWVALLLVGLGATMVDGDKLLESPKALWLLVHLPIAVLLAEHARALRKDAPATGGDPLRSDAGAAQ
ncbi:MULTISPECIES: O-antigen ligase family protein [unclassified Microbulbifer]|uniref:O-antigen ligase family protein n=1 Tax=unclassified Microbulbifer TaxID=2619833 RepID=UPI0027E54232|nr:MULTISPECIES: O-antigen ligase family protein [unclassified Microbulbifer]